MNTKHKHKKIAHVSTVDTSLEALLLNQLMFLLQQGFQVIGISSSGKTVHRLESNGIYHIAIPMRRNISPILDLISLWYLYRIMRREKFAIVHTHTPKAGLLGRLAAKAAGVPVIISTLHGYYFHENMPLWKQRFFITLERIGAGCSDVILSQSAEDVDITLREKIASSEKIKYLGNGINLDQFNPDRFSVADIIQRRQSLGFDDNTLVVGFVGRLAAKRKGFLDFLVAGQKIKAQIPNVRFLVVGDTDYGKPDAVDPSTAKEFGIEEACIFLGHRSNDDLPLLYRVMDVLVLPSLFEGVPRVVMEASAMRVPVVVTDVKGNREAVIHSRNGLLVPYGNVQALAEAVIEILSNPVKAEKLGLEGRKIALEKFDEYEVFKKVEEEYIRLLTEKGLPIPSPRK